MTEANIQLIIAIASFAILWTTSAVLVVVWLESRFRRVESTIYREMAKHIAEDEDRFGDYGLRVQKLELKNFGFTQSP